VGAQLGVSSLASEAPSCPSSSQPGLAEQVIEQLKPTVRTHGGMAQRVALAVLGAMLHSSCS
jgi:hypothetical protein